MVSPISTPPQCATSLSLINDATIARRNTRIDESNQGGSSIINRSQALVLGFFGAIWIALLLILAFAPGIYIDTLKPPPETRTLVEIGFLTALTVLIAVLVVGILRRWRWVFWLIVVAFLAGLLRVPATILELAGVLPAGGPGWYVVLQGVIGVGQFTIALALLLGYRKSGVWGAF
jgi:hypothetical protein